MEPSRSRPVVNSAAARIYPALRGNGIRSPIVD